MASVSCLFCGHVCLPGIWDGCLAFPFPQHLLLPSWVFVEYPLCDGLYCRQGGARQTPTGGTSGGTEGWDTHGDRKIRDHRCYPWCEGAQGSGDS